MDIVIVTFLLFFFLVPILFMLGFYLYESEKISKQMMYLIFGGICLIPYVYSAILMKDGFMVFWVAYTILMLLTLVAVAIIKWFQKH